MIKVFYVDPVGGHAGMHYYDFALCKGLMKHGVDPTYITCDETEIRDVPESLEIKYLFKNIYSEKTVFVRGLNYVLGLREILKQLKDGIDLLHFHFFEIPLIDYFFMRAVKMKNIKVVITAHDVESFTKGHFSKYWINKLYKSADRIIVHAEQNKKEIIQKAKIKSQKVAVIPHGNYNQYVPTIEISKEKAKQWLGVKSSENVILFFGQIKKVKGLDYLLKAFKLILELYPESILCIAGSARKSDFSIYSDLISSLGINNRVMTRIEYIPDEEVAYYFRASEVVVLPYTKIYQSGVLLLSYSFGRPVVASNIGGIQEVVADKETGYLVPPCNVVELAKAIKKILHNRDSAEEMGQRGKELVEKKYSWDRIAHRTKEIYLSLYNPYSDNSQ